MKRLLLTFAIILQGMTLAQSYAQSHAVNNTDSIEILKFKNIPIKGNIKDFDLSAKNPNKNEKIEHKSPIELVENIKLNNALINDLLDEVEEILIGKDIDE